MRDFPKMSRIFEGFSEEDIAKAQLGEHVINNGQSIIVENDPAFKRKIAKIGFKQTKPVQTKIKHKSIKSQSENHHDTPRKEEIQSNIVSEDKSMLVTNNVGADENPQSNSTIIGNNVTSHNPGFKIGSQSNIVESSVIEDEAPDNGGKLLELQMKQRLMEEQNRHRKDMLSKALADRTRQTAEEVLKLEKIKKELQVLDGQFSNDVALLRRKIDQASLTYADAEKNYLKVEKEFLAAKINLQKEKEKKELLSEHLCALITHNETRKARKLETLMLQLTLGEETAADTNTTSDTNTASETNADADTNMAADINTAESLNHTSDEGEAKEAVYAVCEKTGKILMESSN